LFGKKIDLLAFGGSALASFALVAFGAITGVLHTDAPDYLWILCIVAVDVAHVWSTAFRVYLDPAEVRRRPIAYFGIPLCCYLAGVAAYAHGPMTFWRILAYAAVFHFVRQQYGWVSLYRRREKGFVGLDRWLDTATIYAATLYPLVWWHAHLPRSFDWFMTGDFVAAVASPVATLLEPFYWSLLVLFCARQVFLHRSGRSVNHGKVILVLSTWACWWMGIMALDSDYAFTVTNVLIHGVPYLALTYRYGRARSAQEPSGLMAKVLKPGIVAFFAFVVFFAFAEEALWDRWVWHDRSWLFGETAELSDLALLFLVPLLALPQATHYALDGIIWKVRKQNPALLEELGKT